MRLGERRVHQVLLPVSGQALPVMKGEVLRIKQTQGGQCVDFNAFNLHDYKERMSVGHSRQAGFHLTEQATLLSNPPHHRPMLWIAHLPSTCVTDVLGARCDAVLFEQMFGFEFHTNCQDTFAEAVREYDLTPDDVHDSFNMFMNTAWDESGAWWIDWNTGEPNDYVDLLACMDTLSVPIVCGSGDIAPTSNYFLKPIEIEVYTATEDTLATVDELVAQYAAPASRKSFTDYRVQRIRTERELTPNPDYQPEYRSYPLPTESVTVSIPNKTADSLDRLVATGFASDRVDAARRTVMVRLMRETYRLTEGLGAAQRRFPEIPIVD